MEQRKESYLNKHISILRKAFERWRGGTAIIQAYTSSHKSLTIWVMKQEKSGIMIIGCGGTEFIHGVTSWDNCCFELEVDTSGREKIFILRDREANFEVRAGIIEAHENCQIK